MLAIAIVALIVQLGFGGAAFQAMATPVSVAHWLIGLLILRERRLYQILVVAPSAAPGLPEAAERFFAGLKIVGAG